MQADSVRQLLDAATAAVRSAPSDASARMKLFRLLVASRQWQRAATQLETASSLDSGLGFTAVVYGRAVACERFRDEVFAGRRTPVIAGEPSPWLALMIEALRVEPSAAQGLRSEALEQAEAVCGRINGEAFEWIADADSRLGPVIECFIDGKYYWLPFDRVERIDIPEPDDVLDLIWASSEIRLASGGSKHALLPVRYVCSQEVDDDLLMSRKTVWVDDGGGGYEGLGQRIWTTDRSELGLLDVRTLGIG